VRCATDLTPHDPREKRSEAPAEKEKKAAVENWWQRRWKRHTEISNEKRN
jgi:hypothetical protein